VYSNYSSFQFKKTRAFLPRTKIIFLLFSWFLFLLKAVKIQFTWRMFSPKLTLGLRSNEQDPLLICLTQGRFLCTWRGGWEHLLHSLHLLVLPWLRWCGWWIHVLRSWSVTLQLLSYCSSLFTSHDFFTKVIRLSSLGGDTKTSMIFWGFGPYLIGSSNIVPSLAESQTFPPFHRCGVRFLQLQHWYVHPLCWGMAVPRWGPSPCDHPCQIPWSRLGWSNPVDEDITHLDAQKLLH
jgi:hypothetical protein